MGQFSVLHINKYKKLGGIGSHIDRRHSVRNVDPSKTHLNEDLVYQFTTEETLEKSVSRRINSGYTQSRAIRKDAVRALGIILGGTHERIKEIEADEPLFHAWKKANYDFVCREFGTKNIVRFSLHRDERTPHFHCVVVPLTPDGKLSADHFIGTPAKLRGYQDRYALLMKKFGLQRGIHKELTHRKHVSGRDYYKAVNALADEVKELTSEIKSSNVFKLDQIRNKIEAHVTQLKVKAMEQETKARYAQVSHTSVVEQRNEQFLKDRFAQESSQAFDWIKREIPLVDFAVSKLGWGIVKAKSTKRDLVLEHATHGKIIVPTRPQSRNGHWVFSLPNQRGGGTLIDLLRQEKWTWKAIKALAKGYVAPPVAEFIPKSAFDSVRKHITDPVQQEQMAMQRMAEVKVTPTVRETYLEKRGIAKENYQAFFQLKTNSFQAVFGLYTVSRDQTQLCSTINYYFDRSGTSRKYFQKDLPRGLAVLSPAQAVRHVLVTESPIDALSYRQLQLDSGDLETKKQMERTMLLATCGSLSAEINKSLEAVFEKAHAEKQEIILAFDNDQAGKKMSRELERLLQEQQCNYRLAIPELGKDWNESLELQGRDGAVQQFLAEDKLHGFPQVQYEDSILHRAGIPQSALRGVAYKARERAVIFGLHQRVSPTPPLCSTVTYQWDTSGVERKYFQQGLPRGLSVLCPEKHAKHIVVTESPLAAIQHRQNNEQADHTLYLCTCGKLTQGIKKTLSQVFSNAQSQNQSVALIGLSKYDEKGIQELLRDQKIIAVSSPNPSSHQTLHAVLSGIAQTFGVLAGRSPSAGLHEDEDEEEKNMKKRTNRGRKV